MHCFILYSQFSKYVKFCKPSMLQSKKYIINDYSILGSSGNLSMDPSKSLQVAGEVYRLARPWKTNLKPSSLGTIFRQAPSSK